MSDDGSKLRNDAQLINKLVEIVVFLMKLFCATLNKHKNSYFVAVFNSHVKLNVL